MISGGELILINPTKKRTIKKRQSKKGGEKMAKSKQRKQRQRSAALTVRNPAPPRRGRLRRHSRRAAGSVGGAIGGLKIGESVIRAAQNAGGMLAASFFAKRFAPGGDLRSSWSWQNYAMATLGGFASGLLAEMVRKGSGQQFLQGSIALCMYRLVSDTMAARMPFIQSNFGELPASSLSVDSSNYLPGDVFQGADENYILGDDGLWRSTDDDYRMLGGDVRPASSLGDVVRPASSLGETMQPIGPLGSN